MSEIKDCIIRSKMTRCEVNEIISDFLELEDNIYLGNTHSHNWKCKCGNTFKKCFKVIKRDNSYKCKDCKIDKQNEYYKSNVESQGYTLIEVLRLGDETDYGYKIKDKHNVLRVKHNYCGNIYDVPSGNFINHNQRCSKCCTSYKNSFEYYIENNTDLNICELWSSENEISPKYVYKKSNKEFKLICKKHGQYEMSLDEFCRHGCSMCSSSKIEDIVIEILKNNKIDFIYNKAYFKNLVGVSGVLLRPDFILPELKIWIEIDGEFHYKDIFKDGYYKYQVKNDEIKDKYAKRTGWDLIRIPYWKIDDIESIIGGIINE